MRSLLLLLLSACSAEAEPPAEVPVWLRDAGLPAAVEDPFAWSASGAPVAVGGEGALSLRLVVPEGHLVYVDALEFEVVDAAGLEIGPVAPPPGEVRPDPAGEPVDRATYAADTWIRVPVRAPADAAPGLRTVRLSVRHQGCRAGLCFPPRRTALEVVVPVRAAPG